YPWRLFAHRTFQTGHIPLWNPYQFCGTPFLANSQSAVLYPGNLLFWLLPTERAFAYSSALHLILCGWFTYLLVRRLRISSVASLLAGAVFAFCAWQVSWLQLPSFLATACWLPLILRQIHIAMVDLPPVKGKLTNANGGSRVRSLCGLAAATACMLTAGHLQIALYGALAAVLWTAALALRRTTPARHWIRAAALLAAGALGFLAAAPQLLPVVELSRLSHRVERPTEQGYAAYVSYALQPMELASLALPTYFGNDDPSTPYWGFYSRTAPDGSIVALRHNAAEAAVFVGILPLMLGVAAIVALIGRRALEAASGAVIFFAALAGLSLLLALGTPLNRIFYFGIPGFGASGSPARVLVLWSLSFAVLSAAGLDALRAGRLSRAIALVALAAAALLPAIGLAYASAAAANPPAGIDVPSVGDNLARLGFQCGVEVLMLAAGVFLLFTYTAPGGGRSRIHFSMPLGVVALTVFDLLSSGQMLNPSAPATELYPVTPGIKLLQERAGHERILPINLLWSLQSAPPAVLPPNSATVYQLHDAQGYDSLFTGQFKQFANGAAVDRGGYRDSSPPEVGNMVFMENGRSKAARETAAAYAVTVPPGSSGFRPDSAPAAPPLAVADPGMAIFPMQHPVPRARLVAIAARDQPAGTIERWLRDEPDRVTLAVESSTSSRLLLADQY
ncbi:MAG TPA: hypothetical protein VGS41_12340, partial [Chthonomonadales bacterium]|nr:hypothetical protein [Chthonomonadales bacterium]